MARLLYIFPHPDDESFGPAPALARQRREGHEVYLLTLTRGEATSQRQKYGYSKAEMGAVRTREMEAVARVLDLTELTVLDFPDGGFADLDPLVLVDAVQTHIAEVQPDVVVTYVTHGISGHPDHLVGHAVVKHACCALRAAGAGYPRRLAFFTLRPSDDAPAHLRSTPEADLDCIVPVDADDLARGHEALACYETYREVVEQHQPMNQVRDGVCFVLFQESPQPPLQRLTDDLPGAVR